LREESRRLSSTLSVTMRTSSNPHPLQLLRENLRLRAVELERLHHGQPVFTRQLDRMELNPARYILRFTLCEKFPPKVGEIFPPPRHSGEEVLPARARPVPFCRHGLLVRLVDLAARLLLSRSLARIGEVRRTSWCTSDSL
jgi:hypothetical protein